MMIDIPKLLVESSFCMLAFYTFYFFFLKKETFFQLNRFYLIVTPFLALVIPQLNISLNKVQSEPAMEVVYPALAASEEIERFFWSEPVVPGPNTVITLGDISFYLYLFGVFLMSIHLLLNLWRLSSLIMKSKKRQLKQAVLVEINASMPIASFFNYIFWKKDPQGEADHLIWEHEKVHMRQWHSLDLLFMEVMVIINWFNPLIYLFRKSLRLTHEYIADQAVVQYTNARFAYASLLAKQSIQQKNSRLLNTFYSLTKMRLIMLGRNNSKPWLGFKYFLSLPLLLGLGLLFSFDLASPLSQPLAGPFNEAEQYLEHLGEKPINLQSESDNSSYQIQWGDYTCDCYNDQFPNFYECNPSTIPLKKFKQLAKKSEGFTLFQNGQAIAIQDLEVMSKRMLQLDGYEGQFDQQGTFDKESIFWDKLKKGDVLKFTFKANQKQVFTFDVTINDRKNKLDYAYYFSFEGEDFPIDMTSNISVRTVDLVEFSRLINQPLSMKKNDGSPLQIKELKISNQKAMREQSLSQPPSTLVLSDYLAVKEAEPGDRIALKVETLDGQKLQLAFDIRKNAAWTKDRRKLELVWDNRSFPANTQPIFMEPDQLKTLADHPMSFRLNGKALNIASINSASLSLPEEKRNNNYLRCELDNYEESWRCLSELFKNPEVGDSYFLFDIQTDSGHQLHLMIKLVEDKNNTSIFQITRDTVPEKPNKEAKAVKKEKPSKEAKAIKEAKPIKKEKPLKTEEKKAVKEAKAVKKEKPLKEEEKVKVKKAEMEEKGASKGVEKLFKEAEKEEGNKIKFNTEEALIILDGEEVNLARMREIDPDTIEKIDVIKGESAITKFGEKGQNGVIVISTKEK